MAQPPVDRGLAGGGIQPLTDDELADAQAGGAVPVPPGALAVPYGAQLPTGEVVTGPVEREPLSTREARMFAGEG